MGGCYHGMVDMGAYWHRRGGNRGAETDDVQEDERKECQKTNIRGLISTDEKNDRLFCAAGRSKPALALPGA